MGDKVYSVTQLNKSIRKVLLERSAALRDVWIEGEISGWKVYQSGHAYFTLKDAESQVSCVLFSFNCANCQREFTARVAGGGAFFMRPGRPRRRRRPAEGRGPAAGRRSGAAAPRGGLRDASSAGEKALQNADPACII